jgi:hypothetical protein
VVTKPRSTIWLGTRRLGNTPLRKVELPSGCYAIRAAAADGRERRITIEVVPNIHVYYPIDIEPRADSPP